MEETKKTPEIRFKGFSGNWGQHKFYDIAETRRGLTYNPTNIRDSGIRVLRSSNINEDYFVFGESDVFVEESAINIPLIRNGDILITSANGSTRLVGKHAIVNGLSADSAVHGGFMLAATTDKPYFVNALMSTPWYEKFIDLYVAGGNGAIGNLNKSDLDNQDILIPSDSEQQKIGDYFKNLDALIASQQQKYDTLCNTKKAMLQKMFPQGDSKVPEVRFKGFDGEWERKTVDEWGSFYYGRSCPKWSVSNNAPIPCVRYGELYTKFGSKIDNVFSHTNMDPKNLRFSKGTEVLIPRVGEDPMDYNHCTWLSIANVAIGEMISVYNTNNNPLFTAIMFNATLKKEFAVRVEGGSVTNLYFEKLKEIMVSFPSLKEQEKIANYFSNLDNLINQQQQKLEKLKNIKSAMLEKMFV